MASMGSSAPRGTHETGRRLLFLIVAAFAVSAFFLQLWGGPDGSVTVLTRSDDGVRTLGTLSLSNGVLTPITGADPQTVTTVSARTFRLADGTTITLDPAGIVAQSEGAQKALLVASPVPPLLRTPLSVWGAGDLLAWVSPADGSIQVFYKNERGAYLPFLLNTELRANSLGFNEDGTVLALGKMNAETTDIYALDLETGAVTMVARVPGLVSVVPTI
jgi:hypothetical protein